MVRFRSRYGDSSPMITCTFERAPLGYRSYIDRGWLCFKSVAYIYTSMPRGKVAIRVAPECRTDDDLCVSLLIFGTSSAARYISCLEIGIFVCRLARIFFLLWLSSANFCSEMMGGVLRVGEITFI